MRYLWIRMKTTIPMRTQTSIERIRLSTPKSNQIIIEFVLKLNYLNKIDINSFFMIFESITFDFIIISPILFSNTIQCSWSLG